jgi:hypothetical protein
MAPAINPERNWRSKEIRKGTPRMEHNTTIMELICSKLLFCENERQETQTSTGLLTTQQMDQEELECITADSLHHQPAHQMYPVHIIQYTVGV